MKFLTSILVFSISLVILTGNPIYSGQAGTDAAPIPEDLFGTGWELREDLPVFSDPKTASFSGRIHQKEALIRIAFKMSHRDGSDSSQEALRLSFDPKYLFILGSPVLMDTRSGQSREIDYVFENERLIFHVPVSGRLQYIECRVASRKLGNRGELTIEEKLKQSRTIRRIRPRLQSWSPLAPQQVIAQQTLRPIISHGGYAADGVKRAVVWANSSRLSGSFELIDALRNRQHPARQPVVYRGRLEPVGFHIWGGNNYLADFSDFKKEGLFYLRLRVNETKEITDSYVFPIKQNLYLDLAVKAADWFTFQRCGMEVPGFHKACHTDDVIIKKDGTRVDVSGGWHDAGDYGKWIWGGSMGILGLTAFQDETGHELGTTPGGFPRYIDEAAWEADYFCKAYWDGAFHPGFTPDFEDVCTWLGAPEQEPPRVVYEADTIKNNYGIILGPPICLTGALLARVGRQVRVYDKELSDRCLAVAKDTYARARKAEINLSLPEFAPWKGGYLYYLQSGLLFADLEFYEMTGDRTYLQDAEFRVKNILDVQDEEGFFYNDQERTSPNTTCGVFMVALYDFISRHPGNSLGPRIKEAFRRWAEYTRPFARVSPFGQVGGPAADGSIRNIKPNTNNGRFGDVAWGLAAAALLLKDPGYLQLAESQLQWILGFNPADVSMMADVGRGPGCYHTRYCFMEGCEDGVVPGGITLGIVPGEGTTIELGDMDTKNWVIADVPLDYPILDTDVHGWTFAYRTSEYALAKNASFIRAAVMIHKAQKE
jgi:hypothetical protein